MKKIYTLLALLACSLYSLSAQEVQQEEQKTEQKTEEHIITTTVEADTILLTEDEEEIRTLILDELHLDGTYEALPDEALLPITRQQAEELLTKLIVEARAPRQLEMKRADALRRIKIERLKEKMLDYALGAMYTDPLQRRIESLERLVFALLANNKDIDPSTLTLLMQQPEGARQQLYLYPQATQQAPAQATTDQKAPKREAKKQHAKGEEPQKPIAISLQAPAEQIEYFMSQVFFGFDSSKLSKEAKQVLDDVAAWMKSNKLSISLNGYASLEGKMAYNNKLSGKRVKAVADYLKAQGIPESRIQQVPSGIDSIKERRSEYRDARRVDIRPVLY